MAKGRSAESRIAERLRAYLRENPTVSKDSLANLLKVGRSTAYALVEGKAAPKLRTLAMISQVTGASAHYLVTGEGPELVTQSRASTTLEEDLAESISRRVTALRPAPSGKQWKVSGAEALDAITKVAARAAADQERAYLERQAIIDGLTDAFSVIQAAEDLARRASRDERKQLAQLTSAAAELDRRISRRVKSLKLPGTALIRLKDAKIQPREPAEMVSLPAPDVDEKAPF